MEKAQSLINSEISFYIRNSKNQKVGIIKAIKYNNNVFIVHSKCNIKVDKFNAITGDNICIDRGKYMSKVVDKDIVRKKKISQKPTRALNKEYNKMMNRAQKYFKDVSKNNFYRYIDFFEYSL